MTVVPSFLPRSRFTTPAAAILVALPAVIFYSILLHTALDLPYQDDYGALLRFLNGMARCQGTVAKISWFLAAQDNEYKLYLGHAIAWLQLALLGHVNIRLLCAVGNASVLLLAILLWRMAPDRGRHLGDRLALFIPVAWLLFQLQYVETLNWAMPSLQNLPVVFFALAAIYLLPKGAGWPLMGALACFALAVAASGNGFLLVPIGLLMLATAGRYRHLTYWLIASACMASIYAYRYNAMSSQSRPRGSVLSALLRPHPLYPICFLGSFAASPFEGHSFRLQIAASLLAGIVLIGFSIYCWSRGYVRKNPVIAYSVLFLFLTAVGVAGLRSDFGLSQSLASRYAIYSILLVIFAWFALVEEVGINTLQWEKVLGVAIVVSILFSLFMDRRGWLFLYRRNANIIAGMIAFETPGSTAGPVLPVPGQAQAFTSLVAIAPVILRESMRLGIYEPPRKVRR